MRPGPVWHTGPARTIEEDGVMRARTGHRLLLQVMTSLVLLLAAAAPSGAQDRYPSRPISLILAYAAGGGSDAIARVVRTRLETAVAEALRSPDLGVRIKNDGALPSDLRGEAFRSFIAAERKRWGEVVRDANIKLKE
jgi:tripartite-type tricarboxylate transporter receptor subunit TctC